MKRSAALATLSRDHHVTLAHALKLRRAGDHDVAATTAVFLAHLVGDGRRHFAQEEAVLVPALPPDAAPLGERMKAEHAEIIERAAALGAEPSVDAAHELGELLAEHVRFEERELFTAIETLPTDTLADIAERLHS